MKREQSGLLQLLDRRWKDEVSHLPDQYRGKGKATYGQIHHTARAVAEWDLSDPFAYGRTALHVKQGYLKPEEVQKEMHQRVTARRVARAKEVDETNGS